MLFSGIRDDIVPIQILAL